MEQNNQEIKFWNISIDELYEELNISKNGLTNSDANSRLKKFGYNEITKEKKEKILLIFTRQLKNPLIWILIFCTSISFLLNDRLEATLILTMILMYVLLGFFQEYKTAKTFELLKKYTISKTKVFRNNPNYRY